LAVTPPFKGGELRSGLGMPLGGAMSAGQGENLVANPSFPSIRKRAFRRGDTLVITFDIGYTGME